MLVAGTLELEKALEGLAAHRPVFHSEADFQLALAWELRQLDPGIRVRLETRPESGIHLDLSCERPDLHHLTALELKYLTRSWSGEHDGELYNLKNHGAQDVRGYDVVKDISRVERFVDARPGSNGVVVVLSNDPYYWRPKTAGPDNTNAAAFRISDSNVLEGVREWGPRTGAGTKKSREEAIFLFGRYVLKWQDYSSINSNGRTATEFRFLLVPVDTSKPE